MSRYDFFVSNMVCPVCGAMSCADESTNMQTRLSEHPDMARLAVGDNLVLDLNQIRQNEYVGYETVGLPAPGEPIHILHSWECGSCGASFNWAEVVVHDATIQSITAVQLDRAHLERSHLVHQDAIEVVHKLTGMSYKSINYNDLVRLLREIL